MRIGVDVSIFRMNQAGIARYLHNVLCRLVEVAGHEFYLYSPVPVELNLPAGNWHVRFGAGLGSLVGSYWYQTVCPGMLAEDRIDVFWGQNQMLPVRLRRKCRRLVTVHDITAVLLPDSMPLRSRLLSRLYLIPAARAADTVLVDSLATGRLVVQCLGVPRERVRVVLPGLDRGFSAMPTHGARRRVAEAFGIKRDYLLAVGTVEPRKDYASLLKAVAMARGLPQLVIVGGRGWRCRKTMSAVRAAQAKGQVRYLGRVADVELRALYSAARLMVYPSRYEGFGLPVLEAMACGCPVVCSWSSSLPEVGGGAVAYFEVGNATALAARLQELSADDGLLRRMAADGVRRASRFSFDTTASSVLETMEETSC